MATWIIGDVHGHRRELDALVAELSLTAADHLLFVGDLVNGGVDSLGCVRRAFELGATVCLGNHDLHMLAVWAGAREPRDSDNFLAVLEARDAEELLGWLTAQRLAWFDEACDVLVVHAGVLPSWDVDSALAHAAEVERALTDDRAGFFADMYGNEPAQWDDSLEGAERLRVIVNAMTRMRVIDPDGRMSFDYSGTYDDIPAGRCAWFDHPERRTRGTRIVFGHWSALGLRREEDVVCIDSGVRWGGPLTAMRSEDGVVVQVPRAR